MLIQDTTNISIASEKNLKEPIKLSSFTQTAKFNNDIIKNNVYHKIIHIINQRKPGRIYILCNI